MKLALDQFQYINTRRGVKYDLSVGAEIEGELVGFILNAVGIWEETITAYDCGTGVIPEFRKQGIGEKLFEFSLPILKAERVKQYLLEVIQTNTPAFNLYKKRNFNITREFDCLKVDRSDLESMLQNVNDLEKDIIILEYKEIDWEIAGEFWDHPPSWQNSIASISRVKDSFHFLGAFKDDEFIGYMVSELGGGITQLGIKKDYRNINLIEEFLKKLIIKIPDLESLNIINIDTRNIYVLSSLQNLGFESFVKQFEMIKSI
jgi:hypothetical protein